MKNSLFIVDGSLRAAFVQYLIPSVAPYRLLPSLWKVRRIVDRPGIRFAEAAQQATCHSRARLGYSKCGHATQ